MKTTSKSYSLLMFECETGILIMLFTTILGGVIGGAVAALTSNPILIIGVTVTTASFTSVLLNIARVKIHGKLLEIDMRESRENLFGAYK